MKARAKQIILASGAIWLTGVTPRAGEQVEFRGSTSVELPKPKRPLDDNRRMRMDPERPSVEGGLSTAPPIENSPLSNRKLREALDKRKNWIFANPYEQHYDSKTEEFMQGEKGTGLYDNRWMESKEEKSAVQKFLEEKDNRTKQGERTGKDDLPERGQSTRESASQGRTDELETKREENLSVGLPKSEFEKSIFQSGGSLDPFRSGTLDKSFDRNLPGENPFSKPLVNTPEKDDLRQRSVEHEREFNQIITTRLGSGSPAGSSIGRLDNLQVGGGGVGQLDLRGGGSGLNVGRSLGSGPSTVTFTDGGPSLGARSTFDGRSFGGDFSVAPKAAPSYAPAPQSPVAQRSAGSPAPFTLPFPQRKF